ncbi:protein kinase [Tritrichomonas foetus]|uniref:Protein kinase n=1 Tax=Tritrichomonas foetus TaxID=1144522 RepID=A0A1J4J9C5_9EUKA|nr:protein kinase [Tritrichomonas foetus]|eukprot:OHS93828.1 protein kinase [Tritrichomonas foetus]
MSSYADRPELPPIEDQFVELKLLHYGKHSKTFLCRHLFTSEDVIIEKFAYKSPAPAELMNMISRQTMNRKILSSVSTMHHTYDVVRKLNFTWYISEDISSDSIGQTVYGNPFPQAQAKYIFFLMVNTVQILHSHLLSVNDWRPIHFVVCGAMIKFMNYSGLMPKGTVRNNSTISYLGDPRWMAPEMLLSKEYDLEQVDIWGLGLYLHFMLTGYPVFENPYEMFKNLQNFQYVPPPNISEDAGDLLSHILALDPTKRFSIHEILNHKFMMPSVPFPMNRLPVEQTPEIMEWLYFFDLNRDKIIEKFRSLVCDDETLLFSLSLLAISKGRSPKDIKPPVFPKMNEVLLKYAQLPNKLEIDITVEDSKENTDALVNEEKKKKEKQSATLHKLLSVCTSGLEKKGIKVEHLKAYVNAQGYPNLK